ncbi:hypothetical protein P3T36_000016 [Kitasatospora sp. MAP12-15]|nr:hypothetical protein [Kitasatospora sp. MAP12-44]MDH6109244.1 hypothetical protein [Kitasatospora sp. MAP12-44]
MPDTRALRPLRLATEGAVDARAVLALLEGRLRDAGVAFLPPVEILKSAP